MDERVKTLPGEAGPADRIPVAVKDLTKVYGAVTAVDRGLAMVVFQHHT